MTNQHACETVQPLMSGYLDNELDHEQQEKLRKHLDGCPACREEFDKMKQLVQATATLRIETPPTEDLDHFLDSVYNRAERQAGWLIFILGMCVLAVVGVYLFVTEPWGSALAKVCVATPIVGLGVLFVSVLRQRLVAAKTDRYSKEIDR